MPIWSTKTRDSCGGAGTNRSSAAGLSPPRPRTSFRRNETAEAESGPSARPEVDTPGEYPSPAIDDDSFVQPPVESIDERPAAGRSFYSHECSPLATWYG